MSTVPYSLWSSILSWFTPTVFFVFLNLTIGTIYFTSTLSSSKPSSDAQRQYHPDDETNPKFVRSPSMLQRLKSINLYAYRSQEPVVASATTAYESVPDVGDFHFSFQQQTPQQQHQPSFERSPSVLQRLKSINLYGYFSPEQTKTHESYPHNPPEVAQGEGHDEKVQEPEKQDEREGTQGEGKTPPEVAQGEGHDEKVQEPVKQDEREGTQGEGKTLDEVYSQLKEGNHVARTKSDTKPASGEVPTKLPRKMKKSASVKSAFRHFEEEDIVENRRPATVREGKEKATEEEDDEVDAKADDFINKFKHQLKLQKLDSIIRYKEMINRGSAVLQEKGRAGHTYKDPTFCFGLKGTEQKRNDGGIEIEGRDGVIC
ncbi:hypothetical protein Gotur_017185 [Gossypium turneri]